jgi:hypothetical protein
MAFVEFVQNDHRYAIQLRILDDASGKNPFRDEADPGAGAVDLLEPHRVAHRLAGSFREFVGNPRRCKPSGKPSGFQDEDLTLSGKAGVEQRPWQTGCLSGSGGSGYDKSRVRTKQFDGFRQEWIDGKGFEWRERYGVLLSVQFADRVPAGARRPQLS